jgi:hypothetical protein
MKGLFRPKPLTADRLRAREEARLMNEQLRELKANARSTINPAGQQPGASVGPSKVQRAAEEAVKTETPQQREREAFGTEL